MYVNIIAGMSWNINGMWRPLQHNINSLKAALVYWLVDRIAVWEDPVPSVLWRCWLGGRKAIRPVKTEWWGAGMVIWLERGADLHMAQLMPLSLASVKSRLVFPFWYRLTWVVPDKGPLKTGVCVRGPRFVCHHGRLCLLWQPLRYAVLGMGCVA